MGSPSEATGRERIVVDNIHGDISLSDLEWRVVNTATFQRLRSLKQLGMGHFVYPNATHTRFAHSLGVFGIMQRIVKLLKLQKPRVKDSTIQNLRLAALLHDIGHYPYSHLMERVDNVKLTEEEVTGGKKRTATITSAPYPDHEELGRHILENQEDIQRAIGSKERAVEIAELFSRTKAADPQMSKLIHSSLDMDRLDYLLRDARAAGVPYGEIDLDYLLNNIRISPEGALGVELKALPAAEHFLLARLYMHRVVYFHKTTFGMEEACRQLLRRLRDKKAPGLAGDGEAVKALCAGPELNTFTDDYVDRIIRKAATDKKPEIQTLAQCITSRRPPRLLAEVNGLEDKNAEIHLGDYFRQQCRQMLPALAKKYGIPLGQFLLCGPKPIKIEERGALLSRGELSKLASEEREELIKLFVPGKEEPVSIVDLDGGIVKLLSGHRFGIHRLYLADLADGADTTFREIREQVPKWTRP